MPEVPPSRLWGGTFDQKNLKPNANKNRKHLLGTKDSAQSSTAPGKPGEGSKEKPAGKPAGKPVRKKGLGVRSWLRFDRNGNVEVLESDKYGIMRRVSIPARDLRILDPLLSYPSTILGREKAIVVNLEHIKAIITAEEVLLNHNQSQSHRDDAIITSFVEELRRRLPMHFNALGQQVAGDGGAGLSDNEEPRRSELPSPAGTSPSGVAGVEILLSSPRSSPPSPTFQQDALQRITSPVRSRSPLGMPPPPRGLPYKPPASLPDQAAPSTLTADAGRGSTNGVPAAAAASSAVNSNANVGQAPKPGKGTSEPSSGGPSGSGFTTSIAESSPAAMGLERKKKMAQGEEEVQVEMADMRGPNALPFEFRALEVCLEAACHTMEAETSALEKEAIPVLDALTSQISTFNLERVRHIKSRLVAVSGRVQKVRDEIEQLLDDDRDMAEMYLTDKMEKIALAEDGVRSILSPPRPPSAPGSPSSNSNSNSGKLPLAYSPDSSPSNRHRFKRVLSVNHQHAGRPSLLSENTNTNTSSSTTTAKGAGAAAPLPASSSKGAMDRDPFSGLESKSGRLERFLEARERGRGEAEGEGAGRATEEETEEEEGEEEEEEQEEEEDGNGDAETGGEEEEEEEEGKRDGGLTGAAGVSSETEGGKTEEESEREGLLRRRSKERGSRRSKGGKSSSSSSGGSGSSSSRSSSNSRGGVDVLDVEELEMLLEAYFVQIDGTLNKLMTLREYVDDTEDFINIMLDDRQNQLLRMSVLVTTATLVISTYVVVIGWFGMNVPFRERDPKYASSFYWIIGGCSAGSILLFFIVIGYCWWARLIEF